jgi:hypothetical protein
MYARLAPWSELLAQWGQRSREMGTRDYQARIAGLLYLFMSVTSTIALSRIPSWSTSGEGLHGIAGKIAAAPFQYRFGIVCDLAAQALFVVLVIALFELFKGVNRRLALLMVALVLVQVPMAFANLLLAAAPLALQSGADYLSAFSKDQLDALTAAALHVRGYGIKSIMVFWGLWLLPFGLLAFRSGFIPRLLGMLLVIGCFGHVAVGLTSLLLPNYERAVAPLTALAFGEILIALWLLLKGAPLAPQDSQTSQQDRASH